MNTIDGRIVKGVGGLYFVDTADGVYKCSARGLFRKEKEIPTIGDFVSLNILPEQNKCVGSIQTIHPRRNMLVRPKVSNVDMAVIVFSLVSPDISLDRLDRFIILAEKQNVAVTICINKVDLASSEALQEVVQLYDGLYEIVPVSTKDGTGFAQLKAALDKKVSVLAGPSGVGKSSIINAIVPDFFLKTGVISTKIERGKHTTRQVELLKAWEDTFIIDTPGFTSLTLDGIEPEELQNYFVEFRPFLNQCRFFDCLHVNASECAIQENVGGAIKEQRYKRYCDLLGEFKQRR